MPCEHYFTIVRNGKEVYKKCIYCGKEIKIVNED